MWIRLCVVVAVTSRIFAQHVGTRAHQGDDSFEWGWQLTPSGEGPGSGTAGHYYVKLPQSEQRVRYAADGSSYHSSVVNTTDGHHTHTSNVAVGQRTFEPGEQQEPDMYLTPPKPSPQPTQLDGSQPSVDVYLLQQQYTSSNQPDLVEIPPSPTSYPTSYITPLYNIRTTHTHNEKSDNERNEVHSKPLRKEDDRETLPTVRVFKNCTHNSKVARESVSDLRKNKDLYAEIPSYDSRDVSGSFGAKEESKRPITYRGAVHYRVETPRPHARNERFYYTTDRVPTVTENVNVTQEGIDKLVASTQDLISNEDLLRINHAIEKYISDTSDDLIKPKSRFTVRAQQTNNFGDRTGANNEAKQNVENIVKGDIEHLDIDKSTNQVLQVDSGNYKFVTPIIVQDSSYNNAKEQIVNNIVSTMVPYIANGYEIIGVRDSFENTTYVDNKGPPEDIVQVTPRPIGQNYLAPITVALRLLNANDSEDLDFQSDTVDDHEPSDSELIADTVDIPKKEKTTVEIQESIPIEITHINDVEVHEYLDEGRVNKGSLDVAQNLYNKYIEALKLKRAQEDAYNDANTNDYENDNGEKDEDYKDYKDNLEPSENMQTEVEVKPGEDSSNERSEYVHYYTDSNSDSQKIIQPIIIEKEVPVTKFVDRFIERQVPYPERVEVPVPVDRPVPVEVPVEKIVEKPVEVTRYVDKPYPVEISRPYPVEIKVPYPVEQKIYVDRPVQIPYPVERVVEKQILHPVPIPTPVGIQVPVERNVLYPIAVEKPVPVAVEVEKPVPVEKIVHKEVRVPYPVEHKVPYPVPYETKVPVPYPVEKRIHVPVEKIVEKPVTVTKIVEKPIHIEVPRPVAVPVHVHHPYPVDRIVEKKVPYPVQVDRIVEKKVQVPYPVEKIVEKIVEKPVVVTKYIDKPYPVEKRVPYPVEKVVERKVPYPVQVPIGIKVPYPVEKIVEKPVHIPVHVYHYIQETEESRNNYQYQKPGVQNQPRAHSQLQALTQYYQLLKERQKLPNIQSTHWGNFPSNFQHNNTNKLTDLKTAQTLTNYINYLTNSQYSPYQNRQQNQNQINDINKNYVLELKLRRTDRVPKMTNLRIEYGGFKPPLIPSTEVDLDGIPVNKEA